MNTIDVGKDFYHRLANRDKNQGDGKHTAIEFRNKYLAPFDNAEAWKSATQNRITLDFKYVKKIGPSFANEAFAYFTKYTSPSSFLKKVIFVNIDEVHKLIIEEELESGYTGK